jgi:hypothetical protein
MHSTDHNIQINKINSLPDNIYNSLSENEKVEHNLSMKYNGSVYEVVPHGMNIEYSLHHVNKYADLTHYKTDTYGDYISTNKVNSETMHRTGSVFKMNRLSYITTTDPTTTQQLNQIVKRAIDGSGVLSIIQYLMLIPEAGKGERVSICCAPGTPPSVLPSCPSSSDSSCSSLPAPFTPEHTFGNWLGIDSLNFCFAETVPSKDQLCPLILNLNHIGLPAEPINDGVFLYPNNVKVEPATNSGKGSVGISIIDPVFVNAKYDGDTTTFSIFTSVVARVNASPYLTLKYTPNKN